MTSSDLFNGFCISRNIRDSTVRSYLSAVRKYESYNGMSMSQLIDEAICEEENVIPIKKRKIRRRLLDFRAYLLNSTLAIGTVRTYFSRIKTVYRHFEIGLPHIPDIRSKESYISSYDDLPKREDIKRACSISSIGFKAAILFISSSGCAKAETLSLTVRDFIKATKDYHDGGSFDDILKGLLSRRDMVPVFYLRRIKTGKFYHAFCSPEASYHIVRYLISRKSLSLDDRLFDFTDSSLMYSFKKVNDELNWGFVGNYRFFRFHALRKFHASNIGLGVDLVDELQGRAKTKVHEAYIKTNPKRLKEIYMSAMHNVMVFDEWVEKKKSSDDMGEFGAVVIKRQEINIVFNFSLDGMDYRVE